MALIAPIEPAAWPETLADIRRRMGTPLNVHRVLASYPAWLHAWFPFRNHVVHGTSLSSRQYDTGGAAGRDPYRHGAVCVWECLQ